MMMNSELVSSRLVALSVNHTDTFSMGRDNQDILIDPTPFSLAVRLAGDEGGPYRITSTSLLAHTMSVFVLKIAVQTQTVPLFLSVVFMMSIEDVLLSDSTILMPLVMREATSSGTSDLKSRSRPTVSTVHNILYSSSTEQFSITGAPPIGDKTRPGPGTSLNTI